MPRENMQTEYHCDVCGLPTTGPSRVVVVPGENRVQITHMAYDPTPEIENLKTQVEILREAVESTVPPELMKQVDAKVVEYLSDLDSGVNGNDYQDTAAGDF